MKKTDLPSLKINDIEEELKKVTNSNDEPRKDSKDIYYSAYKNSEKALEKLIKKFPGHDNLDEVYLKVTAINSLYSTNIYDTYRMAYHIFTNVSDIDKRLEDMDPQLIHDIAYGHKIYSTRKTSKEENPKICFYSFATKYCSFHNPKKYAIYDTLIQDFLIKQYNQNIATQTKEEKKRYEDLREYKTFMQVLDEVKKYYKLDEVPLKEFDMYLWLNGKKKQLEETSQNHKSSPNTQDY